jgi:hypothetical protein
MPIRALAAVPLRQSMPVAGRKEIQTVGRSGQMGGRGIDRDQQIQPIMTAAVAESPSARTTNHAPSAEAQAASSNGPFPN